MEILVAGAIGAMVVALGAALVRNRRRLARARQAAAETASASAATRAPGWYQDPFDPGGERYWSGVQWTGDVRRWDPQAAPGARGRVDRSTRHVPNSWRR